jgi:hypothetical protein
MQLVCLFAFACPRVTKQTVGFKETGVDCWTDVKGQVISECGAAGYTTLPRQSSAADSY